MRETRSSGSAEGVVRNRDSYSDFWYETAVTKGVMSLYDDDDMGTTV